MKFPEEDKFIFEIKDSENYLRIFLRDKNKKIEKSKYCEISVSELITNSQK